MRERPVLKLGRYPATPNSVVHLASQFPNFWRRHGLTAWLLLPLAGLFALLAGARRWMFAKGWLRSQRVSVPVIVVGNVTVGGSGKTPVVLALVQALNRAGWRPGVISRGYGGTVSAPRSVRPDDDPQVVGDEPLLLARRCDCPVWVGPDRPAVAQALLAANPECRVLISDDGLQHYRLARNMELVVLDPAGLGNRFPLPAGPMREPLGRIKKAQAVIVHGDPAEAGELESLGCKAFRMELVADRFWRLGNERALARANQFADRRLHALAGIGRPERFFAQLESMGLVFERHPFPDHHRFTPDNLTVPPGDVLLMTEKDAVKCEGLTQSECWVLRVEARIEPDLAAFVLESLNGSATA